MHPPGSALPPREMISCREFIAERRELYRVREVLETALGHEPRTGSSPAICADMRALVLPRVEDLYLLYRQLSISTSVCENIGCFEGYPPSLLLLITDDEFWASYLEEVAQRRPARPSQIPARLQFLLHSCEERSRLELPQRNENAIASGLLRASLEAVAAISAAEVAAELLSKLIEVLQDAAHHAADRCSALVREQCEILLQFLFEHRAAKDALTRALISRDAAALRDA